MGKTLPLLLISMDAGLVRLVLGALLTSLLGLVGVVVSQCIMIASQSVFPSAYLWWRWDISLDIGFQRRVLLSAIGFALPPVVLLSYKATISNGLLSLLVAFPTVVLLWKLVRAFNKSDDEAFTRILPEGTQNPVQTILDFLSG